MARLLPSHLRLTTTPATDPAGVISSDHYRITVLTTRLVRLEWSATGEFEDRATQVVINREFAAPEFEVFRDGEALQLRTSHLQLDYDGQEFSARGLTIRLLGGAMSYHSTWRYGEPAEYSKFLRMDTNLKGTARTLDAVDGATPLEDGLVSIYGIAALDDTSSLALTEDGWVAPRTPGDRDVYVFAHGKDSAGALADFYALTGPQPLLPRYALGNWWSRYHPYTDEEYRALIERFGLERIPFSVAVVDMDWHVTDVPPDVGTGWTGFTWNRALFPDPAGFLAWLHDRGLRISLNLHPADGIRHHEESYERVATGMGFDPATKRAVNFDLADPDFRTAYFEQVLHPMEDDGVDFWWLDWQQGTHSLVPGLDPLWLLNHLHFLDSARSGRRALTFSRYAGPGSHRYPVGFSGDSVISWASLAFQPYFTSTASNIGYGWWSHDIGGHMFGVSDDELATRWVQLGTFSPINRLHSTLDAFNSKEPWRFNAIARQVQGDFLRLRHRLLPYLYTMNHRAHANARPICEPLYWGAPSLEALEHPSSFRFGTELLVAAIVQPCVPGLGLAAATSLLPPGLWFDVFTGLGYDGGRKVTLYRPLEEYPVLAPEGAILPLTGPDELGIGNPDTLEVRVFAGANGDFTLYEDDDAADPAAVRTRFSFDWTAGTFVVHPAEVSAGAEGVVPAVRDYTVVLVGAAQTTAAGLETTWDERTGSLTIRLGEVTTADGTVVHLDGPLEVGDNDVHRRVYELVDRAEIRFDTKDAIVAALAGLTTSGAQLRALLELNLEADVLAAVAEVVGARV